MTDVLLSAAEGPTIALHAVTEAQLEGFLAQALPPLAALAELSRFKAKAAQTLVWPGQDGAEAIALFGLGEKPEANALVFRAAPAKLPPGDYRLADIPQGVAFEAIALAWAQGAYAFDRLRQKKADPRPRLVAPDGADLAQARSVAAACALARDLVNRPANDLGPVELEMAAREVAEAFGAAIAVVTGDDLLAQNYPAIHAVGRAADAKHAPRMIEITWGEAGRPLVALVGKGVIFDTGGLDLKPSAGMRLMKKDMGGAAHALALGRMVMAAGLPVRLAVLLPVAENAVSGDAMRPGDVLASRKGLSIEVGNTDAEGRLILADALARAAELEPALTIDLATLTGAARAALGPDVVPFYTDDDALAGELADAAQAVGDPLWRMPLWGGYESAIESDIADLKNDPDAWAQAGSVTAALFLKRFAPAGSWAHFDIFAWNPRSRPGWPVGAEAQAIRALFQVLKARFPVTAADARLTLAKGGFAAASLQGLVPAPLYRPTTTLQCAAPSSAVRPSPSEDTRLDDQVLFGELFDVLEDDGDWAFGQATRSGYVGYVRRADLAARAATPSHWVNALAAEIHAAPGERAASLGALPMNALVGVEVRDGAFALAAGLGWLRSEQLSAIGVHVADYVAAAERFLGQPYLWGGRGGGGIDCSGLVQQGLFAAGRASPRDADQQASLGLAIAAEDLRRGDLVFWREHVAIVTAPGRILHASSDHGAVVTESLAEALERRGGRGDEPIAWRRPVA